MNKFISVTVDGKILSVNVNHIVAIEENNDGCTIYLSCPLKSYASRNVQESREEILAQINE